MKKVSCLLCGLVGLAALCWSATLHAQQQPDDDVVNLVVGLLAEQDRDMRALGLEQVRTGAKGRAATEKFAAELPKLLPDAQVGLLSALADRGDTAARPGILALLSKTGDGSVRTAAIKALGPLGDTADVPLLIRALAQGAEEEKPAAQRSLVQLRGADVSKAIAEEMQQAPAELQVALIGILASRHAVETIPDLLAAAEGDEAAVRAAAMTAIGEIAGPEHIPGMVRGVLKAEPGREREAAEKAVMFVCARIADTNKRADPLLAAVDELDASDRSALLSTLGRVGGPKALEVVETAIADNDPAMHELGLRALCNWPNASVSSQLMDLARTEPLEKHRIMALRSLIRVAPLPDDRSDAERLALLKQAMAMATRNEERQLVLDRARGIRTSQTLRFLLPYVDQAPLAEQACLSIVELAHHRELREPNKAEFDKALEKVIETSKDPVVIDRAQRYKKGQTWTGSK